MRKPHRRTVAALLFALAAGVATAALQPGTTPQTNGLLAAKAVAARVATAVEERAPGTAAADPGNAQEAAQETARWATGLIGDPLGRR